MEWMICRVNILPSLGLRSSVIPDISIIPCLHLLTEVKGEHVLFTKWRLIVGI